METAVAERVAMDPAIVDPPEQELWSGGISPWSMLGQWLLGVAISVAVIVVALQFEEPIYKLGLLAVPLVWVLLLFRYWLMRINVRYRLSNKWLTFERGLLVRTVHKLELRDVQDVSILQSLAGRILGYGTLYLRSDNEVGNGKFQLDSISSPDTVEQLINEARRADELRFRALPGANTTSR